MRNVGVLLVVLLGLAGMTYGLAAVWVRIGPLYVALILLAPWLLWCAVLAYSHSQGWTRKDLILEFRDGAAAIARDTAVVAGLVLTSYLVLSNVIGVIEREKEDPSDLVLDKAVDMPAEVSNEIDALMQENEALKRRRPYPQPEPSNPEGK